MSDKGVNRKRKLSDPADTNPKKKLKRNEPEDKEDKKEQEQEEEKVEETVCECGESCELVECLECGDVHGCQECVFDRDAGLFCAKCEGFSCFQCNLVVICETCLEMWCVECMEFKPDSNGAWQCNGCQPRWKKKRKASEFCNGCTSTSEEADVCARCQKRFCSDCQQDIGDMGSCKTCGEFHCYSYSCRNHAHDTKSKPIKPNLFKTIGAYYA